MNDQSSDSHYNRLGEVMSDDACQLDSLWLSTAAAGTCLKSTGDVAAAMDLELGLWGAAAYAEHVLKPVPGSQVRLWLACNHCVGCLMLRLQCAALCSAVGQFWRRCCCRFRSISGLHTHIEESVCLELVPHGCCSIAQW
jgi:hypothetical protein